MDVFSEAILAMWPTMLEHWFPVLLFALILLGMTGLIGRGLGLQNIFHDDPELLKRYGGPWGRRVWLNSPALFSQAAIVVFLTYLWGFGYTLGIGDVPGTMDRLGPVVTLQVTVSALLSLALGMVRVTGAVGPLQRLEWLRCLIGALLGLVVAWGSIGAALVIHARLPENWLDGPTYALGIVGFVTMSLALRYRRLLPGVSLAALLTLIVNVYALISTVTDVYQPLALAGIGFAIYAFNGFRSKRDPKIKPLKFNIPGIVDRAGHSHYAPGNLLALAPIYAAEGAGAAKESETVSYRMALSRAAPRVPPLDALRAWHARAAAVQGEKPKLVLLATSGGAYRAAFWTAEVLDHLAEADRAGALKGLCQGIRLITGASGGMVGASYFTTMAREDGPPAGSVRARMEDDILESQRRGGDRVPGYPYTTVTPIPRDSLSAVAQQLVQRDIPLLFSDHVQLTDRGTVLEDQWATLDVPFADLAPGEAEGWRPSILFSPMLVETGQPLLIGNLDMTSICDDRTTEVVKFFDWFPGSHTTFRLKTAARLNASFPYIAPSAALPTDPYRRVVDAGYYDNYGVDMAITYLAEPGIRDWITRNCSGVMLIQIRAFPFEPPSVEQPSAVLRAFQWLTTPVEGILSARGATMTFRNRQSLRHLQETYRLATGSGDVDGDVNGRAGSDDEAFLQTIRFEVKSDTSLNWYLPRRELDELVAAWDDAPNRAALDTLTTFWKRPATQATT